MNVDEQIAEFLNGQPEAKRNDLQELHRLILVILPGCKLWFDDGINEENRTINNPTIGYGVHIMSYAKGNTREVFQIGLSPNKTGISVYILGLKDKKYLVQNFSETIGKASVTGYCIKFKALKDINVDILKSAIRYGVECSGNN